MRQNNYTMTQLTTLAFEMTKVNKYLILNLLFAYGITLHFGNIQLIHNLIRKLNYFFWSFANNQRTSVFCCVDHYSMGAR